MPLPGAPAARAGYGYEDRWIARLLVDLLSERVAEVCIEEPGNGRFECYVIRTQNTAQKTYYQAKRQNPRGHWSLAELDGESVLRNVFDQLKEVGAECEFVSTTDAYELRELATRASQAASFTQFEESFLAAKGLSEAFAKLQTYWSVSAEATFELLKRVRVTTIEERLLESTVRALLEPLVEGEPEAVLATVLRIIGDSVHRTLTPTSLWSAMESYGHRRRAWANDPHVLERIRQQNGRYMGSFVTDLDTELPRAEVDEVLALLGVQSETTGRSVLLSGAAGAGKSHVALQLMQSLSAEGVAVLALRVDTIHPATTSRDVGEQLHLPGSPASVLIAVAQGRPAVLVIDQLDSVSSTSGKLVESYSAIHEMIGEAGAHPNLRLVLVCREFDLNQDQRLRQLRESNATVVVGLLPQEAVVAALNQGEPANLSTNATLVELLRLPLNLGLFWSLQEDLGSSAAVAHSTTDLFNAYWQQKDRTLRHRTLTHLGWVSVAYRLAEYFAHHQVLSAPIAHFDEYAAEVDAMVSEHILARHGEQVSFFHESFYDYVAARRFVSEGGNLVHLLETGPQHLHRRRLVRQVLIYHRSTDYGTYIAEYRALLGSTKTRFHIKHHAIALLALVADPREEEWDLLVDMLAHEDEHLAGEARRALRGTVGWFDLATSKGLLASLLASQHQEDLDLAELMLIQFAKRRPEAVARLLEPCMEDPRHHQTVNHVLAINGVNHPALLPPAIALVDAGLTSGGRIWELLYRSSGSPSNAATVLKHYLDRGMERTASAGGTNPFDKEHPGIEHSAIMETALEELAVAGPAYLVDAVLPTFLGILELNRGEADGGLFEDHVWRFSGMSDALTYGNTTEEVLRRALRSAVLKLAKASPDEARPTIERLWGSPYRTSQRLLLTAFEANPLAYKDMILDYFAADPSRLDAPYEGECGWGTRRVLEPLGPHLTEKEFARVEALILSHHPASEFERHPRHNERRMCWPILYLLGWQRLILLDALPEHRLSERGRRELGELRRRFAVEEGRLPEPSLKPMVGFVQSPIDEVCARKMSDDQWLEAIKSHTGEGTTWRNGQPIGGAYQLATVLQARATERPQRFAALLQRFPVGTPHVYYDRILEGLAKSPVDIETAATVIDVCHSISERPVGKAVIRLIEVLARRDHVLPQRLWEVLHDLALHDPDPQPDSTDFLDSRAEPDGGLYMQGINSVRGQASIAIATVMGEDPQAIPALQTAIVGLASDDSMAVRGCATWCLLTLCNHNEKRAIELFLSMCEAARDDRFFCMPPVERFLAHVLGVHTELVSHILERMLVSDVPSVVETGAYLACLADLREDTDRWLSECLIGTSAQRLGAALVLAGNLDEEVTRALVAAALCQLFHDESPEVRRVAARCFDNLGAGTPATYRELIGEFAISPAFNTDSDSLFRALSEMEEPPPDLICDVLEPWLATPRTLDVSDPRSHGWFRGVDSAAGLAFAAYRRAMASDDEELQARCLSSIEALIKSGEIPARSIPAHFDMLA